MPVNTSFSETWLDILKIRTKTDKERFDWSMAGMGDSWKQTLASRCGFTEGRNRILARVHKVSDDVVNGLQIWASHIVKEGERLTVNLRSPDPAPQVLRYLVEHGGEVFEFTPQRLSLEYRFLQILGADEGL